MFAQLPAIAERARVYFEGVTTTEGRLAVSVGLLLVALIVARFVAPRLIDRTERALTDRFVRGRFADAADLLSDYVPTLGEVLLRAVQVGIFVLTGVGVLLVWEQTDLMWYAVSDLLDRLPLIRNIAITLLLGFTAYVGAAILSDWISNFSQQAEWMTDHQEEIVLRISQLCLFGFMGLVVLDVWGARLDGLLVGAGFLGIVVGLAARQTLGSLIAGFVLMFSRPFTIGDWVRIGDQEGVVTDITIMHTRLENFDGEFVIIPNDKVSNQAITNRSQKGLLRLRIDIGIDYGADPKRAKTVILDAIRDLPDIVQAPPPQVFPREFGDSAIVLETRFWIDHPTPPRRWKATSAVIYAIKEALDEADIKIPYPQRELSGRAETGGFRVHERAGETDHGDREPPSRPAEHD